VTMKRIIQMGRRVFFWTVLVIFGYLLALGLILFLEQSEFIADDNEFVQVPFVPLAGVSEMCPTIENAMCEYADFCRTSSTWMFGRNVYVRTRGDSGSDVKVRVEWRRD